MSLERFNLIERFTMIRKLFLLLVILSTSSHMSLAQNFGDFTFSALPQDFQLYPRKSTNEATIAIDGKLSKNTYSDLGFFLSRNGVLNKVIKQKLTFSNNSASFSQRMNIKAELAEYGLDVYAYNGKDSTKIVSRNNIVAGDVYFVTGQSNAWIGEIDKTVYMKEWVRSFGLVQPPNNYGPYNKADTLWTVPNDVSSKQINRIGPFAAEMARLIIESENIPVAMLNSGAGGSYIDFHLQLDGKIDGAIDGGNIMYYKAVKAGVVNDVKGIIYRQGENESAEKDLALLWPTKLNQLLDKYKKYFPSVQYVFAPQLNVFEFTCSEASKLRETVRQLHTNNPYVKSFATVGTIGFDRLHYSVKGYQQTALEQFRLISKYIYKKTYSPQIESPNIKRAYFESEQTRNKLFLEFDEGQELSIIQDTTITDLQGNRVTRKLAKNFFWDSINMGSFEPYIKQIEAQGNKIILTFTQDYLGTVIGYLPDYNRDFVGGRSEFAFQGPFIKNKLGMRAFAFSAFPVVSLDKLSFDFRLSPNPSSDLIELYWENPANGDLEVYDMAGKLVYKNTLVKANYISINASSWIAANYFVSFKSNTGRTYSKRLAILH